MDFAADAVTTEYADKLQAFLDEHVYPAEAEFERQAETSGWSRPPIMEELKKEARSRGLWNLFLPREHQERHGYGAGLTNLQYAPLAELTGRSPTIAPEAINCAAPDTGNMELLSLFGTDQQRAEWLEPLLAGEIRSAFSMTEPAVASSDATNIETAIRRDGDEYVIQGRKWWSSGAMNPNCRIAIVMGVTDPDADRHRRQSMILVPLDTPGVTIEGSTTVFGYRDGPEGGHGIIHYDDVRVPATNLLGEPGSGFALAQARLGPGRIHHCMRLIGMAERALELMVDRVKSRVAFGRPVADQGTGRESIALSRIEIDQARLYVLQTADLIDRYGAKGAKTEISAIKVAAPRVALAVIDRAIQLHGGAGVSNDTVLARFYASARTLRIVDGPDAVHIRGVAKEELARERPFSG